MKEDEGQAELRRFMNMLCGSFDNMEQCRREEAAGARIHPEARHIIGICNDRMVNLPENFSGYFVIEESHFDLGSRRIDKQYLFSYAMEGTRIRLTSWNIPASMDKETFVNSNPDISIDYTALEISPRFSPLLLEPAGDAYVGENASTFSADHVFNFRLEVTRDALYVTEALVKDGQLVAGYHTPVIYKKSGH